MSTELPPVGVPRGYSIRTTPLLLLEKKPAVEVQQDEFQNTKGGTTVSVNSPARQRASWGRWAGRTSVGAAMLAAVVFPISEGGPLDVIPGLPHGVCLASMDDYRPPPVAFVPDKLHTKELKPAAKNLAVQLHERHKRVRTHNRDAAQPQAARVIRALVAQPGFGKLSEAVQVKLLNIVGRTVSSGHGEARRTMMRAMGAANFKGASPDKQALLLIAWAKAEPHVAESYGWSDSVRADLEVVSTLSAEQKPSAEDLVLLKRYIQEDVNWVKHTIAVHGVQVSVLSDPSVEHYRLGEIQQALGRNTALTAAHLRRIVLVPPSAAKMFEAGDEDMHDHGVDDEPAREPGTVSDEIPNEWPQSNADDPDSEMPHLKQPGPRPEISQASHFNLCFRLKVASPDGDDGGYAAIAFPDGVTLMRPPSRHPGEPLNLGSLLTHESGHHLAGAHWGWGGGEDKWKAYRAASQKDGVSVSAYGYTNVHEDFSEHLALYVRVVGTPLESDARALYGERFKLIDELYNNPGR